MKTSILFSLISSAARNLENPELYNIQNIFIYTVFCSYSERVKHTSKY